MERIPIDGRNVFFSVKMADPAVEILLSTYNGGQFLSELLDSLLCQTYRSWRLTVRDDGSSDGTSAVLERYAPRLGARMALLRDERGNIGPCRSFSLLLKQATAELVMFCDQDDIWEDIKIEKSVQAMLGATSEHGERPLLVYSDLALVDGTGRVVCDSYLRHLNISCRNDDNPYYVLYQNPAAGCTILMNRQARELCVPVGEAAVMHDAWCAAACCFGGALVCIDRPLVRYRQHGANWFGAPPRRAKPYNLAAYLFRLGWRLLRSPSKGRTALRRHRRLIAQAEQLANTRGFAFSRLRYFAEILFGKYLAGPVSVVAPAYRNRGWRYERRARQGAT